MREYKELTKQALRIDVSCNAIALSRGVSHHTVRRARDMAIACGLTEASIDAMSDSAFATIMYPRKKQHNKIYPDWAEEAEYRAKGYNLLECHARYVEREGQENAIGYSRYCEGMRDFGRSQAVIFRHNHPAGYAIQTDFAGYRPKGLENGVAKKFELFVAVLPLSSYVFALATRSQSTGDHIEANIAAVEYFGGVSEVVIQDNLKAAIIARPKRAAPIINPAFLAFADYYGMRVEPTRVRHPKDKAAVEISVKLVQRFLKLRLSSQPLMRLHEINIILADIVDMLNARVMRRGGESRHQRFVRLEQAALRPLPAQRLQFIELPVERRVKHDHHVSLDKVHYSVPHRLTDKIVSVRASSKVVEIRHDGQIVAVHPRSYAVDEFVTVDAHRPEGHLAYITMSFDKWRTSLNPKVDVLVTVAMAETLNEKRERTRIMDKVRRLLRLYGEGRLITAIAIATKADALTIKNVGNLLHNNRDAANDTATGTPRGIDPQSNVRGAGYFDRDLKKKGAGQ